MLFCNLASDALIDTSDLCRIFAPSARTVCSGITQNSLRSAGKIGREILFTKGDVIHWFNANCSVSGRPPALCRRCP